MMSIDGQPNSVRARRIVRGWSQQDLADRTGLSRAGISAIEAGRLAPSVTAALALAKALGSTVEQLFGAAADSATEIVWGVPPLAPSPRYWNARVGERTLSFPIGEDSPQLDWHDAVYHQDVPCAIDAEVAERTLVVAGCDPAAGLLASEYTRQFQLRMIVLRRNSQDALGLLAEGKVHAAGIHLGQPGERFSNARAARSRLGKKCELLRVAAWEEGLAVSPSLKQTSSDALANAQWVGREEGAGARQCQNEILGSRPAPKRIAHDHRMVAAAIKCGWAEVGPCVRLACEEAGLRFLRMHEKNYDLCFLSDASADARISALLATVRSRRFRSKLGDLPGYQTRQTGELGV